MDYCFSYEEQLQYFPRSTSIITIIIIIISMEYFFCPSTILFDIWPGRSNDPGKIYIAIKRLFLLATKTKTKIFSHYHRVFLSPIFVDIWPWRSDAGSVSPIFALVSPSIHANNAAWNIQNIYQQYLFFKERRLSYFQNIHMKCQRPASFQISIKMI